MAGVDYCGGIKVKLEKKQKITAPKKPNGGKKKEKK